MTSVPSLTELQFARTSEQPERAFRTVNIERLVEPSFPHDVSRWGWYELKLSYSLLWSWVTYDYGIRGSFFPVLSVPRRYSWKLDRFHVTGQESKDKHAEAFSGWVETQRGPQCDSGFTRWREMHESSSEVEPVLIPALWAQWQEEINNFIKKDNENENQQSNDLVNDDTWQWEVKEKEAG